MRSWAAGLHRDSITKQAQGYWDIEWKTRTFVSRASSGASWTLWIARAKLDFVLEPKQRPLEHRRKKRSDLIRNGEGIVLGNSLEKQVVTPGTWTRHKGASNTNEKIPVFHSNTLSYFYFLHWASSTTALRLKKLLEAPAELNLHKHTTAPHTDVFQLGAKRRQLIQQLKR